MAGSVNKVILIGNLGQDPEVRSFQTGGRVAQLRLATSESWKDRQTGERKERTEWHSVAILTDGLVGVVDRYLRKGSKVYIEGQLRTRKWQDQAGQDRYSTEVVVNGPRAQLVMLDSAKPGHPEQSRSDVSKDQRSGSNAGGTGTGQSPPVNTTGGSADQGDWGDQLDDDIPF